MEPTPHLKSPYWKSTQKVANYAITGQDTQSGFHNSNAPTNITLTLPKAIVGGASLQYKFLVSTAHTITVTPKVATDTIRGFPAGTSIPLAGIGTTLHLECWIPGFWEIVTETSIIGGQFFNITPAEIAIGALVINFQYPGGNNGYVYPDRYATNATPGTTDMTPAINTAFLVAAQGRGSTVQFLPNIYGISSAINAKSYTKMLGTYGETILQGGPTDAGTKLLWIGGNVTATMLNCFNVRLFALEGLVLDAGSAGTNTNITGILLDSNNNPSGSQNEFFRFSIRNCIIGVQWGTSGLGSAFANDGTRFTCFTIWSNLPGATGFIVNSGNAGQDSVIESGGIQVPGPGIDIIVCNYLQIRRVFGSNKMLPAFIRSATPFGILIEGCSSEGWGNNPGQTRASDSAFLLVNAFAGGTAQALWQPITLIQNQINNPIICNYPCRIVSIGDTWGQCLQAPSYAATINATGTFNNSLGVGISRCTQIENGVNPASIDSTTGPFSGTPTQGWIDSAFVNLTRNDAGLGWIQPSFISTLFTANGTMTWTVVAGNVEFFGYTLFNRTMTIAFRIIASTIVAPLSNELRIQIPSGKIVSQPMLINSCSIIDNGGTPVSGTAIVDAGNTYVAIRRLDGANFSASTSATAIKGQISFEVN